MLRKGGGHDAGEQLNPWQVLFCHSQVGSFSQCGGCPTQLALDLLHHSWAPMPVFLCVLPLMAWNSNYLLSRPALGQRTPSLC